VQGPGRPGGLHAGHVVRVLLRHRCVARARARAGPPRGAVASLVASCFVRAHRACYQGGVFPRCTRRPAPWLAAPPVRACMFLLASSCRPLCILRNRACFTPAALAYAVAAWSPTIDIACTVLPLIVGVQLLFAGCLVPVRHSRHPALMATTLNLPGLGCIIPTTFIANLLSASLVVTHCSLQSPGCFSLQQASRPVAATSLHHLPRLPCPPPIASHRRRPTLQRPQLVDVPRWLIWVSWLNPLRYTWASGGRSAVARSGGASPSSCTCCVRNLHAAHRSPSSPSDKKPRKRRKPTHHLAGHSPPLSLTHAPQSWSTNLLGRAPSLSTGSPSWCISR
jgi:hypothetical protein